MSVTRIPFSVIADNQRTHTQRVISEFVELAANDDNVWELLADALIETRKLPGEQADNLLTVLRAYSAR